MRETASGRSRARRCQGGFTLIELLVVISILGILASVAALSMVGITFVANENARRTEHALVQQAMDAMVADQRVSADQACVYAGAATSRMDEFPVHRQPGAGAEEQPVALYPKYLRQAATRFSYRCAGGQVVRG